MDSAFLAFVESCSAGRQLCHVKGSEGVEGGLLIGSLLFRLLCRQFQKIGR